MVYGFVRQSNGAVRVHSDPGQGTRFSLYLPRLNGEGGRAGQAEDKAHAEAAGDGETVLVVDDEATVRMLIVETLKDLGYRALEAEHGEAGLDIIRSPARVDLLVTDVGMPGLNGRQFADAARDLRPGLPVLFITGYAHNAALSNGHGLGAGMELLTKPFTLDTLATKMRGMIRSGATA